MLEVTMGSDAIASGGGIALCVTTCRRDEGLERLLASISDLDDLEQVPLTVVVVDNAGSLEAKRISECWGRKHGISVRYAHESQRGISYARNRALREVPEDAEFVAFLDDDEVATPGWLTAMMEGVNRFNADVWNGPVLSEYPADTPDWVMRGKFHERPRRASGTARDRANTGNVMFRRSLLDRLDLWFDPELARSGGEDDDFFGRAVVAGAKIVWVDDAVVYERLEQARVSAKWILRRAYQYGYASTVIRRKRGGAGRMGAALVKACARVFLTPLTFWVGLLRVEWGVKAVGSGARGLGVFAALLGKDYKGY
ncbi:glycosyltransferase family 2 protein [Sulfuriroseicoccus oceanibius]|uniref:Glycosyltransferase n=1 Tax=Sulfuriroseicoccus oceanibius TaxID=2707525 RepID=A0A6B3L3H2_9BACT|nr:glycosyltransferase [Sulfuriroseicoccus oceanibius]QQL45624.1 glycosyltransferase [Sulfuriroseicoccus oceanibius]